MAKKFQYAPGMPGYGTSGTDGSTGLTGIATYFSSYDGDTDTASIRTRITANNILFPGSEPLPGYPDRIYQTGDTFIDRNAKVWEIDLTTVNGYVDTGIAINTSGLFEDSELNTNHGFDRYTNLYNTGKLLIDNVYSSGAVGNYTQTPGYIYGTLTRNYGQVKFVDLPDPSVAYYPFAVYTTGEDDDAAFAIVKDFNSNTFRMGNVDENNGLRNADLILDFNDVSISGNLTVVGNFEVDALDTASLHLTQWLRVDGDTSVGNLYTTNIRPSWHNLYDIGTTTTRYKNLWLEGNADIDGTVDVQGTVTAPTFAGALSGNAATATQWATARSITLSGDVTGTSPTWNGTGNLAFANTVVGNDSHDHSNSTITSLDAGKINTGTLPVARGGTGAATLTSNSVLTGDAANPIVAESNLTFNGTTLKANASRIWAAIAGTDTSPSLAIGLTSDNGFFANSTDEIGVTINEEHVFTFRAVGSDGVFEGIGDTLLTIQTGSSGTPKTLTIEGQGNVNAIGSGDVEILGGSNSFPSSDGGDVRLNGGDGISNADGGNVYIQPGNGQGTGDDGILYLTVDDVNDGDMYIQGIGITPASNYLTIHTDGRVRRGATIVSDGRLKNLNGKIENALSGLITLTGYNYNWNDLATTVIGTDPSVLNYGLVAQEVEAEFPQNVFDTEGVDGSIYKGVNYPNMVPIIVEAIKEQQTQIEELKDLVVAQQVQINQLLNA